MARKHQVTKLSPASLRSLRPDELVEDLAVFIPDEAEPTALISATLHQVSEEEGRVRFQAVPAPSSRTMALTGKRYAPALKAGSVFVECGLLAPGSVPVVIVERAPASAGTADSPGEEGQTSAPLLARIHYDDDRSAGPASATGLELATGGQWTVTTSSGSVYFFDLDRRLVTRCATARGPQPGYRDTAQLRRDGEPVPLLELHCRAGSPLRMLLRVRDDNVTTLRVTTPVRSIRRLGLPPAA